jgi:DNA repair protein RadC
MLLRDLHPVERPRERLARSGPEALSDAELLALVLRTGYAGRAVTEVAADALRALPGGLAGSHGFSERLATGALRSFLEKKSRAAYGVSCAARFWPEARRYQSLSWS